MIELVAVGGCTLFDRYGYEFNIHFVIIETLLISFET